MASKFLEVKEPVTYIPIPGTDAWDEDENSYQWYERGSEWTRFMATQNLVLHAVEYLPWSTSLDGIPTRKGHVIWKGAAKHLICHLERVPYKDRNLVAHSHGGNVVFHALAYGLNIRTLITVGTPVRADMDAVVLKGLGNCGYWHHIYDSSSDRTSILGALFDGRWRIKHDMDLADSQDNVEDVGHSKILNDHKSIQLWKSRGWVNILAHGKDAFPR